MMRGSPEEVIAFLEQANVLRLDLNEIGFCNLSAAQRVPMDPYAENRQTGAFVLVDRFTNRTAGAGMVALGVVAGPAAGLLALIAPSSGDEPNQCTPLLQQMKEGKAPKTVKG